MALLAATVLLSAAPSAAAEFVYPANDSVHAGAPLSSGQKSTPFSLKLPSGAACTRDSANGGYRVQSFMVPAAVDPLTLRFDSTGPTGNSTGQHFRQPLYAVTAEPYVDAQTAPAEKKDGPGVITNVPAFNLNAYANSDIPVGKYNVGIACTKGPASADQLDGVWSTTFTVDANTAWVTEATALAASTGAVGGGATGASADAASSSSVVHQAAREAAGSKDATTARASRSGRSVGPFLWLIGAAAVARVVYLLRRKPRVIPLMEDR